MDKKSVTFITFVMVDTPKKPARRGRRRKASPMAPGWHPEDIKAAIRKTGVTLTDLSLRAGLSESAVRQAILFHTCPAGERAIVDHLGAHPHELWPRRYDPSGTRVIGNARPRVKVKAIPGRGHRQKQRVA